MDLALLTAVPGLLFFGLCWSLLHHTLKKWTDNSPFFIGSQSEGALELIVA